MPLVRTDTSEGRYDDAGLAAIGDAIGDARRERVFVDLVEMSKENRSLGNGEAHHARAG